MIDLENEGQGGRQQQLQGGFVQFEESLPGSSTVIA